MISKSVAFQLAVITCALSITGCASVRQAPQLPKTFGENYSTNNYIPIDPIPVSTSPGRSCRYHPEWLKIKNINKSDISAQEDVAIATDQQNVLRKIYEPLPQAFPDNTVRIAYKTIDDSGNVSFGPIAATAKNQRYQLILDFINSDTINEKFRVTKSAKIIGTNQIQDFFINDIIDESKYDINSIEINIKRLPRIDNRDETLRIDETPDYTQYATDKIFDAEIIEIPVYVGVGLRIIADVTTIKGDVNLTGLSGFTGAAESGSVSGSLLVQTLGVNGEAVSAVMPIQSELNNATVQNAIVALGSVKTLLYDNDIVLKPRILGFYSSIATDERIVTAITSQLTAPSPIWFRQCNIKDSETSD